MKRVALILAIMALGLSYGIPAESGESIKGREILGIRIGGVHSTSGLDEAFGSGTELEIYFYHGVTPSSAIGVALSGHDFGKSQLPDKDFEFIGIMEPIDYMIYSVTGCYMMKTDLSKKFRLSGELGGGLYTSTSSIPLGAVSEARITHNHFGFYAGGEIWWRLTKGGIHLGLGGKWHYVMTGTDYRQPVYLYTGEESAHYFQLTLGISFKTDN